VNGDEVAYVMTTFECRRLGGTLRADGAEILEARYFAADEFDRLDLSPWARALLPRLVEQRGRTWFAPATWRP
jgi:NADH pyrophosphatase NudC (nudix superfamily)